jgi:hypothetical protein
MTTATNLQARAASHRPRGRLVPGVAWRVPVDRDSRAACAFR